MLCKKCGKYECYERNGRVFALCAVCSWNALQELLDLPDSAAELLRAPVQSEQKCPDCNGDGRKGGIGLSYTCPTCDGTGISNRSDGG